MKYTIIFTILILLSSCSVYKNNTTDLEKFGVKGKVKSLKFEHERNVEEDDNEYSNNIDTKLNFNRNGMIYEERKFSSEGLIQIQLYTYDKNNLLISKTFFSASKDFMNKSKMESVLNKNGKLIKQSEWKSLENSLSDSVNLKYSLIPDQITELFYNSDGSLFKYDIHDRAFSAIKEVVELNDGGIAKSSTINIADGDIFIESVYDCVKYDSEENCTRYKVVDKDSKDSFLNTVIEYY